MKSLETKKKQEEKKKTHQSSKHTRTSGAQYERKINLNRKPILFFIFLLRGTLQNCQRRIWRRSNGKRKPLNDSRYHTYTIAQNIFFFFSKLIQLYHTQQHTFLFFSLSVDRFYLFIISHDRFSLTKCISSTEENVFGGKRKKKIKSFQH